MLCAWYSPRILAAWWYCCLCATLWPAAAPFPIRTDVLGAFRIETELLLDIWDVW